ncbi:hypothetical protein HMPREF9612_00506 [Cutibacterium acnes HL063PA2]|nr:hypothetical protein HMPREF9612_00506 [Cutibacterium acnes HL063PA2]
MPQIELRITLSKHRGHRRPDGTRIDEDGGRPCVRAVQRW